MGLAGGLATNGAIDVSVSGLPATVPLTNQTNTFTQPQTLPVRDKGGQVFNVKSYGAVGNGVADDSAAAQAAYTAAAAVNGRIYFPEGTYSLNTLDGNGNLLTCAASVAIEGDGTYATFINTNQAATWGVLFQSGASQLRNIHLTCAAGGSFVHGAGVDTPGAVGSAEECLFENVRIDPGNGAITNCFAVGPTHAGVGSVDIAETMFHNCRASGAANANFLLGNGTSGNILATYFLNCISSTAPYLVYANRTGFVWLQGAMHGSTFADFYLASGADDAVTIIGLRSEQGARLLYSTISSADDFSVNIRDVNFTPGGGLIATGDFINHGLAGRLVLEGVRCFGQGAPGVTPYILLGTAGYLTVLASGLATSTPLENLFSFAYTQPNITVTVDSYTQLGANGQGLAAVVPGPVVLTGSHHAVQFNGVGRDVGWPQEEQTLAADGAVTINGRQRTTVITLQANATSSTISNGTIGQVMTLDWLQDGTGARTYVWPANCVFGSGVVPPASTSANARDSVTFRYDGTNWNEIGRLMSPDVQIFVGNAAGGGAFSGTWTKRPGSTAVRTRILASGGGGGSGARGATTSALSGGGGGGAGGMSSGDFAASTLGATEAISIAAPGAGGIAVTADSTAGNAGGSGGNATFGNHLKATGGAAGGAGGIAATGTAGGAGSGMVQGSGGGACAAGAAGGNGVGSNFSSGGGAGGGIDSGATTPFAGGNGGVVNASGYAQGTGGAATGAMGTAGTSAPTNEPSAAGGGGGGGAQLAGAGGKGGNGGSYGAGGGGGAAANNGNNSGAGGNGAAGIVVVISQ